MAEEAWDLINQDHLDKNQRDSNKRTNEPVYGMIAISNADTYLSSVEWSGYLGAESDLLILIRDSSMPLPTRKKQVEHNEAILLHAVYRALSY